MASSNVNQVLTGIKNLTDAEKKELADELSKGAVAQRTIIAEAFTKAQTIHTSPISGGKCSCCGK